MGFSAVPSGLAMPGPSYPALKRGAIFDCPSGTTQTAGNSRGEQFCCAPGEFSDATVFLDKDSRLRYTICVNDKTARLRLT